jgi:maltooligosyltrehalose trehalohydrolase
MLGATYLGASRCQFVVWAPLADCLQVKILDPQSGRWSVSAPGHPAGHNDSQLINLERLDRGYHSAVVDGIDPGTQYVYRLDGKERPDPASRLQAEGVHGPSQVVDPRAFRWNDSAWYGLSLDDYLIYEIHVGTFTEQGTFDAIIPHLGEMRDLGITAIELMPVAQFPGARNWGYDGVYPFAVQNSYGGPEGLMRLVNACHDRGLAVVLDVVYNHLGPEGDYLGDFGPYFTDQYRGPWGRALNFDGPGSDEVVRYFTENALHWIGDFHIDALRLDAIHGITDRNAQPFLKLLTRSVHEFARESSRQVHLIAESDFNDVRFIRPVESGGYGLDAQWNDDFHHALRTLLTEERTGYYQDFGKMEHLGKAFAEGFVYSGQYSAYRQRRHGNSSCDIPACQFVVYAQNHDQVGNRLFGDRLSTQVCFEALKLAAGMVILSPYIPLLFMGEEYGEPAPFQYFTSHADAGLIEAVRRGRREEFAAFLWQTEPPDAQSEETFLQSKLDHRLRQREPHRTLFEFYKELIKVRCSLPGLVERRRDHMQVRSDEEEHILRVRRWSEGGEVLVLANFSDELRTVSLDVSAGERHQVLDSADQRWRGPGSSLLECFQSSGEARLSLRPKSFSLFQRLL